MNIWKGSLGSKPKGRLRLSTAALLLSLAVSTPVTAAGGLNTPMAPVEGLPAAPAVSLSLDQAEVWKTSHTAGDDYGFILSGDTAPGVEFRLEYDSGWAKADGDSDTDSWRAWFKEQNISKGKDDTAQPAGSWLGSANAPSGAAAWQTRWSTTPSSLFSHSRPVAGLHASGKYGNVQLSGFSGIVHQKPNAESFSINSGKLHYRLAEENIVPGSEMVQITVHPPGDPSQTIDMFFPDYTLDYVSGALSLAESPAARVGSNEGRLFVTYEYQTQEGGGYRVSGGELAVQSGPYNGALGYLSDTDPRSPKQVATISGGWDDGRQRVQLEAAMPLFLEQKHPDSTAWSAQIGTWLSDSVRLSGQAFRYGTAFPDFPGSEYSPGERGWSLDGLKRWNRAELSAGYSLTTDDSFAEYAGRLQSGSARISLVKDLGNAWSIGVGQNRTSNWAPKDPGYLGERSRDNWVTVTSSGSWNQSFTYGWGSKEHTQIGYATYDRLDTRLYGADVSRHIGAGNQIFLGVRREDSRVPGESVLVDRKDSLLLSLAHSGDRYRLSLDGSVYQNRGTAWAQSQLGSSIGASLEYKPSNRLSLLSSAALQWSGQWEWQGDSQLSWQLSPTLTTQVNLSQTPGERILELKGLWQPRQISPDASVYLSQITGSTGREWLGQDTAKYYTLGAQLELVRLVSLAPSYERKYGPGPETSTTVGLAAHKDLSDRVRLSAHYKQKSGVDSESGSIAQTITGIKGRYSITPGAAIALGHSWGRGFPDGDDPTGWWLGVEL